MRHMYDVCPCQNCFIFLWVDFSDAFSYVVVSCPFYLGHLRVSLSCFSSLVNVWDVIIGLIISLTVDMFCWSLVLSVLSHLFDCRVCVILLECVVHFPVNSILNEAHTGADVYLGIHMIHCVNHIPKSAICICTQNNNSINWCVFHCVCVFLFVWLCVCVIYFASVQEQIHPAYITRHIARQHKHKHSTQYDWIVVIKVDAQIRARVCVWRRKREIDKRKLQFTHIHTYFSNSNFIDSQFTSSYQELCDAKGSTQTENSSISSCKASFVQFRVIYDSRI